MPIGSFRALAALAATSLSPSIPTAQKPGALPEAERARLLQRLQRLDIGHTDWILLLDVGEKTKALGLAAVAVVAAEVAAASGREDPRYAVRLMGVLTRIDPAQGTAKLAAAIDGKQDALAALAARVLGRSGAPAEQVGAVVNARLPKETRSGVAGAMALGAGEAGATGTARLLREQLMGGNLDQDTARWFATALAQLGGKELQAEARTWLKADSPLLAAGVLLVRRARDVKAEAPLLELHAATEDPQLAERIAQTLGSCGGDATRAAFRAALAAQAREAADAGAVVIGSSHLDPRRLTLLRLGDSATVKWARETVAGHGTGVHGKGSGAVTFAGLSPEIAQLPQLLGKWDVPGAVDTLVACSADPKAPCWIRAHAARGLCWRRDPRGLTAAAALLATMGEQARDPFVAEGLTTAQKTLHEFLSDVDRPDYTVIDREAAAPVAELGGQWQAWLARKTGKVTWRDPPQDGDDLLFWY
jgi:hypothetical protein